MIQTYQRLRERRANDGVDGGFTLIELLIVIVILGILAAIVVFALGGVTGKSNTAACQSDARTVGTGVAALEAENPGLTFSSLAWEADMTSVPPAASTQNGTGYIVDGSQTVFGGPFVQTWPSQNGVYTVAVFTTATDFPNVFVPGSTSSTATPAVGDVLVAHGNLTTSTAGGPSTNNWYDATMNPVSACGSAVNG